MNKRTFTHLATATFLTWSGETSFAGMLYELGAHWTNYSFDSDYSGEPSSNYFSLGPQLLLGIEPLEGLDFNLFASYAKTSRSESKPDLAEGSLTGYGGGLRFHFLSDIQLGLGYSVAQMENLNMNDSDLEQLGGWQGAGPYLSLGCSLRAKKDTYPQVSLIVGQWEQSESDFPLLTKTTVTTVAVNLSYVFYQKSVKILDDLISGFL